MLNDIRYSDKWSAKMADLMVRVMTPDYETWLNAFVSAEPGLVDAGINEWTVYQDSWNSNNVMVHFIADDMDRAMAFFGSAEFKDINERSGATGRTFYVAQEQAPAKRAAKTAAKTASKPAATAKKPAAKRATKATTTSTAKPAKTTATKPVTKPVTKTPKK